VTAERLGVPAVGVMTTTFVDAAELMAQACGMPGYPFAVIEHPIANATSEQLLDRARAVLDQAVKLLAPS
jgi:hypothetical protein